MVEHKRTDPAGASAAFLQALHAGGAEPGGEHAINLAGAIRYTLREHIIEPELTLSNVQMLEGLISYLDPRNESSKTNRLEPADLEVVSAALLAALRQRERRTG